MRGDGRRPVREFFNSALFFGLIPVGTRIGRWLGRSIALPQLRELAAGPIPWTPLVKPTAECSVVLISTSGVHLASDEPFKMSGDERFRVIPKSARQADLAITHPAYVKTDALRDISLVFPLERLRELEAAGAIGRLVEEHYAFGLMGSARKLMPPAREVARRVKEVGADLALLVPA
jgi:D-proline reductase (dithiol) PrdB